MSKTKATNFEEFEAALPRDPEILGAAHSLHENTYFLF
jgi:hypothetical protein